MIFELVCECERSSSFSSYHHLKVTQTISIVSTFKTLLTSCLEDTLHHQHSMHLFGYISHTHTKSSSSCLRLFNLFFFFFFSVSLTIEWWEQFSNLNSSAKYSGQRTHYLMAHTLLAGKPLAFVYLGRQRILANCCVDRALNVTWRSERTNGFCG